MRFVVVALFTLWFGSPAHSAEIYRNGGVIYVVGKIESGDEQQFARVVHEYILKTLNQDFVDDIDRHMPKYVVVYSPGGDVIAALAIGRLVRTLRLSTAAPNRDRGGGSRATCEIQNETISYDVSSDIGDRRCVCASACFFIWAAGAYRTPGLINIHRPYFEQSAYVNMTVEQAQQAYADLMADTKAYLKEMGIPDALIGSVFEISSAEMRQLTDDEMDGLMIEPFLEELVLAKCGVAASDCYPKFFGEIRKKAIVEYIKQHGLAYIQNFE